MFNMETFLAVFLVLNNVLEGAGFQTRPLLRPLPLFLWRAKTQMYPLVDNISHHDECVNYNPYIFKTLG